MDKNLNLRKTIIDRLPRWARGRLVKRALTYLTGQFEAGEPLPKRTQVGRVAQSFAVFGLGSIGGVAALAAAGPAGIIALPFAWIAVVGGARDLQLTIYHHCAHGNVISSTWSSRLGHLIDKLLLIERFEAYQPKHAADHHGRHTVSTDDDPTVDFLKNVLRIEPGSPVRENLQRFAIALISPRTHAIMLGRRLVSQFVDGSWADRLAAGGYLAALGAFAVATGLWTPMLVGYVLPLTVGYQLAQCARLPVEHHWPANFAPNGKRGLAAHDDLTLPVRCAVPPLAQWSLVTTARWGAIMIFNALIRATVLPGDSGPSHHWHHSVARGDWANHVQAVAEWEAKRCAKGLPPSAEAWGYGEALTLAFESFAKASQRSLESPRRVLQQGSVAQ